MTVNELKDILKTHQDDQPVFIEVGQSLFELDKAFLFHTERIQPTPLVLTLKGFHKHGAISELDEVFRA